MPLTEQVWIVDDDSSIRWVMEKALTRAGLTSRLFETGQAVLDALASQEPMVVVSDIRMPGMDGLHLLSKIKATLPHLPVIITTAHSDLDSAVNSYEEGAFEYLPKPFDIEEMVSIVSRAQAQRSQTITTDVTSPDPSTTEIIGNAAAMQEVFRAIGRLAHSHITVLINGESGTGKELVARALHRHSPRANSAFVALNMAAIPQELMESELFGHEKGAFTGAIATRQGRFELAAGGTLFLDEIGDMPLEMQVKLLRVLQERTFERVGSTATLEADVRIIAATHQDLEALVEAQKFRMDLFYRLDVFPIKTPSLRERAGDIAGLITHALSKLPEAEGLSLTDAAIEKLGQYAWPGNVRELLNLVERLTILHAGQAVDVQSLPEKYRFSSDARAGTDASLGDAGLPDEGVDLKDHIARMEIRLIQEALDREKGVVAKAAALLGLQRTTLVEKMKKLGIQRD